MSEPSVTTRTFYTVATQEFDRIKNKRVWVDYDWYNRLDTAQGIAATHKRNQRDRLVRITVTVVSQISQVVDTLD